MVLYLAAMLALAFSFIGNFVAIFKGNHAAQLAAYCLVGFIPAYILLLFFWRSYAEDRKFLATFRKEPWPHGFLEHIDKMVLSPVTCAIVSIFGMVTNTILLICLDPALLTYLGFSMSTITSIL